MIERHEFSNLDAAASAAAQALAAGLKAGLAARGRASIALSGGRTPERVLPALAGAELDWSRVSATLIDERWVAPDHPDSNEGLVRRTLLAGQGGAARLIGLKSDFATPEAAIQAGQPALDAVAFPLDVSFIGFGPDGHVASLFPDQAALWRDAPGLFVASPAQAERCARISLTPAALLQTRQFVLVFAGEEKRAVFEAALVPGPAADLPLRLVTNQDRVPVTVFSAP